MQDFLEKISVLFLNFFKQLGVGKRIAFVAICTAIVLGVVLIMRWSMGSSFTTLYNDLNKDDAKQIAVILEEKRIPYQMSDNGSTIKIPSEQIDRLRMELAIMGVNFSGTVDYEIFDKQSFGTTSFVQRINKQRALEGELVKTITYIKGINRARVHLTIPESNPFVAQKERATASVVVDLDRNVTLSSEEIKGIASLISSSVEGMRPEDVVILDGRGKRLSENSGDGVAEYTASMISLENKLNKKYEKQIEEILEKVVGEGGVVAKVSAKLDYSQSSSTETSYDNENAAILSETKNQQKISGSKPAASGVPGVRSNLPGQDVDANVALTKNDVDKEQVTRNYSVPSKVTKTSRPSARIKNISVAVMINGKKVPQLDKNGAVLLDSEGKSKFTYEKWSDADISNFSAIVSSTLGLDTMRGDTLVIKNMEFAESDLRVADAYLVAQQKREFIKNLVKYIAVGLAISLFFIFLVRPFVQWVTDNTVESVEDFLPQTLEELERLQVNQKLPGLEEAVFEIEERLMPEKMESNLLREKINTLVINNPEKAAYLIQDMLNQDDTERQIA